MDLTDPISIYVHVPFCRVKCSYCDFNTYAGLDTLIPTYVEAVCSEITGYKSNSEEIQVGTIFFGGGTPSLMPAKSFEKILSTIESTFKLQSDIEITLEANPATIDKPYLASLFSLGLNRISIGAQSASTEELQLLDRLHTFSHVTQAFAAATAVGFLLINIDLMYGLPNQTEHSWKDTLTQVVSLSPQHLSLYALTLEHGTPMQARVRSGQLPNPNSDIAANMYDHATSYLETYGYRQYEISNWAKRNRYHECKHNLQYWQNLPYIGIGAGAHSWYKQHRYSNTKSPYGYINRLIPSTNTNTNTGNKYPGSTAMIQSEYIDKTTEMHETMMLGMQLVSDGVNHSAFRSRFGIALSDQYKDVLNQLSLQGLIHNDINNVRLTAAGRLLANRVFSEFV